MADLIDRQQALALRFTHAINEDGVVYVQYREYQNGIVRLPSANCQQVTGKLDCISRQAAIETLTRLEPSFRGSVLEQALKNMPPAQPTYTDEEIQKMQDLESAEIEKAYQLGYEEGKKDARAEQKMGRWTVKRLYIKCSECGDCFPLKPQNYCPNCGADMRGDEYD